MLILLPLVRSGWCWFCCCRAALHRISYPFWLLLLLLLLLFPLWQTVTCEEIQKQAVATHATCRPVMNTPKPAPQPAEPAKEAKPAAPAAGAEKDAKGPGVPETVRGEGRNKQVYLVVYSITTVV